MKPQDCLLYVDPSPRGEWALGLAALLPAEVVAAWSLLATVEDLEQDPGLLDRARARVAGSARTVRERRLPGPARAAVVREATEHPYGLVVVPPAGRGAIRRMFKGSRVATIVRRVPASVLVAKRPPVRIERVLAAVSGGPLMRDVIRAAAGLARAWDAQAAYLHVASEVALPFKRHGEAPEGPALPGPQEAVKAIGAAVREIGGSELQVQEGLVADEVLDEVEHGAHQVLVIGGPTGVEREHWADDVVERILIHCPTSVLVVRATGI